VDAVSADFAKGGDVGTSGLEDSQAEQTEHGDEGEVVDVPRVATSTEHRLELQMTQSRGW
jgi:hypothetical protein